MMLLVWRATTDEGVGAMPEFLGAGYVLDSRIGQGASGEVWRGSRRSDGNEFAFKLLRPQLLADPATVGRFLQERATLVGIPAHANLVHIHDLVAEGQRFGIVMDLVRGPDLRKELTERGTLSPSDALMLAAGVFTGTAALHSAGVVHRDIKPENVLLELTETGFVPRITDYGTARLIAESAVTRTTSLVATPEYLAPELADRAEVSGAADVYSIGVMLYELLCGVTPFGGGLPIAVLRRHIDEPPGRPDHLDDRLWHLLSRMLAKQPGQRPTAQVVAAECRSLAQALVDVPAQPKLVTPPLPPGPPPGIRTDTQTVLRPDKHDPAPATKPPSRLLIVIGAGLAAALLVVGVIAALARPSIRTAEPASPTETVTTEVTMTPSTSESETPIASAESSTSDSPSAAPNNSVSPKGEPTELEPIRHRATVPMRAGGKAINLNAPSTDPRWGGYMDVSTAGVARLSDDGYLEINFTEMADLGRQHATYEKCSTQTAYGPVGDEYSTRIPAQRFNGTQCLVWPGDDGDYYARIVYKGSAGSTAKFDITVWYSK